MEATVFEHLRAWWPEAILGAGALLVVLLGAWTKRGQPACAAAWITLVVSALALWARPVGSGASLFSGLIVCDAFSAVFRWIALGVTAIVLGLAMDSRELETEVRAETFGLLLFIGVGLMVMAEASHLLMAYVAMELVSLSSYVLVGFLRDGRGSEASLKYLLFGALSSGIMLFGMSLLYGLTGTLAFQELLPAAGPLADPVAAAVLVAVVLVLAGLAFKISMVPFHFWTPDVYEGAPMAVTALLSVGPKAAGLALLLRLTDALRPAWPMLEPLVLILTVATMTLGNLVALVQTNVKRLLAYSTIGQVGYLLIGFAVNSRSGIEGMLLYLVAYLFMNLGVFACVIAVVNDAGSESIDGFRGLATRAPGLALACAVFLLSLAGIPPLLGFFGKFLLFGSAIEAQHAWLAIAGILNSAVALYYYVNLIRLMYFVPSEFARPLHTGLTLRLALGVCVSATLALGLFPGPLFALLRHVASGHLL